MKTELLDFNQQLFNVENSLHIFAFSFTKNKDDANDLVQDTMLKAIRHAEKFEDGTNLKSWMYMILKNTFINNYRKKNRMKIYMNECVGSVADDLKNNTARNAGESKCTLDNIHSALAKLPYDYYYPFIRYFEGYKYHEIATELNLPIGTVKTRIHLARGVLKKALRCIRMNF
ncbi:RNA polymerase sigma factor [Pedobacter steynii]